jgi:glucan phosphoethanolaminetransferase (alkaline phosphatase superfamily)
VLGTIFYRRSLELDRTGDPQLILGMRKLAAPGVLLFGVTLSFAGFDWMMSLDPTWASTMFGVYTFAGTMLSTLATIILCAQVAQRSGYLKDVINTEHYHDLGKLMFGFIVFWAYIAFSQFFLIWYANLPEETHWFRLHWESGWSSVTVPLIFLHFVIPFFSVLSRFAKRNRTIMLLVPILLVGMHYVDLFWIIVPLKRSEPQLHLRDLTALIGLAGIVLGAVMNRMGASPLIPIKDPMLKAALEYDNG